MHPSMYVQVVRVTHTEDTLGLMRSAARPPRTFALERTDGTDAIPPRRYFGCRASDRFGPDGEGRGEGGSKGDLNFGRPLPTF